MVAGRDVTARWAGRRQSRDRVDAECRRAVTGASAEPAALDVTAGEAL